MKNRLTLAQRFRIKHKFNYKEVMKRVKLYIKKARVYRNLRYVYL